MRDEPVIGCCEKSPSLVFWRRRAAPPALARGRATARPRASVFAFEREGFGAVGKWKTCFWFSTFPSALVVGAVGMWESRLPLARFPRGSWKEWEACFWLSMLSTAPSFPQRFLIVVCGNEPTRSAWLSASAARRRYRSWRPPAAAAWQE